MTIEEVVDIARKRERHAGTYNNAKKDGRAIKTIYRVVQRRSIGTCRKKTSGIIDSGWSEKTETEKNGLILLRNGKRI